MAKHKENQNDAGSGSTDKLLKAIIALLLRQDKGESPPLKKQIEILDGLGMRPVDIAETLGRSQTHVSKELVAIRKNKRGR
jgi:hypothetical protein